MIQILWLIVLMTLSTLVFLAGILPSAAQTTPKIGDNNDR